ncbi:MAG: DUF4386 family protein [Gemmobacter sp.]
MQPLPLRLAALSLIALAVFFNLPYARLAATFDYPAILRRPAAEVLDAFADGGADLILTWHAFALAALLFVPVALAHALAGGRVTAFPALAVAAAVTGALAGLTQAMGLLRWVMVVPDLARTGDVQGFALLHAWAGVALGEHLGMTLTALHVALVGAIQAREGRRMLAVLAGVTAALILGGAQEGAVLALGRDGALFGALAIGGYLALTVWMIGSGAGWLSGQFRLSPGSGGA